MPTQIFALRLEPWRLVAAEVTDEAAATLLDAGEQVLLGTFEELGSLALRLARPLVFIARASASGGASRGTASHQARLHHLSRSPGAVSGRAAVGVVASSGEGARCEPPAARTSVRVA